MVSVYIAVYLREKPSFKLVLPLIVKVGVVGTTPPFEIAIVVSQVILLPSVHIAVIFTLPYFNKVISPVSSTVAIVLSLDI